METSDDKLAHFLKIKFGLAPAEPTSSQLDKIKKEIREIAKTGTPTVADWRKAVYDACPGAGRYKYAGEDMSDLITLLNLAKKDSK